MRQIIMHPVDEGYWIVECPSLPGCIVKGVDREEALKSICSAIEFYEGLFIEEGLPIPKDSFRAATMVV